ncbi:tRNA dihydrouridine synthase DusC [Marinobacterium aestuarii]|uniref:tRNA-dihydrouridine(16) synthase n=1 Tax=Marinobacterium aestuarii TaxID=1821621 RepID=A0A1A9EZE6_9GAMM|nr:tRNA-dihydrouridine synthase [Marinobacterium aestuarii]ANG63257.1 tRNA dihydrouridine synthase DusC [Marinobacterium aestuarii]
MKIILAPMEGVVDYLMRDVLTRIGGIDLCVTEFVRVSQNLLPDTVFHRLAPELLRGGTTPSGVPVIVQLLGSDPELMAANAERAAALGAPGIDLNFGCPAKTVNRNRGGAVLLDTPQDVHAIVAAVRGAVPAHIPVTAKMRLGYSDKALALDNAQAIFEAGADGLAVHARTKVEGYRPPAYWEYIAQIREAIPIPVTANGEVWSWDDYQRCRDVSGCRDIMIGRGLISRPDLARSIKRRLQGEAEAGIDWFEMQGVLLDYFEQIVADKVRGYVHGRLKQWLHQLKKHYPEAEQLFSQVKTLRDIEPIRQLLIEQRAA